MDISRHAQELFEKLNPYPGNALAYHNLRIATFAQELGRSRSVEMDEDLLWTCAWVHDIGLFVHDPAEPLYLRRNWAVVEPHLDDWGLSPEQARKLKVMLRYTHSLRPLKGLEPMADLIRRAVEVEHSHGLWAHGLDRDFVKRTFQRHPRLDLNRIIVDFTRITLLQDGPAQLLGIFLPGREY